MSDDEFPPSDDKYTEGEANGTLSTDLADRVEADEVRTQLDTILEAVSHQRRRNVLYYLYDHTTAATRSLARELTAWEAGVPVDEVSAEDREHMLIDLHHTHLPKLADAGIIEYDPRSGAIRYREPPAMLERCLLFCESLETVE